MIDQIDCHGLDTPEQVHFYEQDFYVLSNFSSFQIRARGFVFPTSEHFYHFERFQRPGKQDGWKDKVAGLLAGEILVAPSAHEAFRIAQESKEFQRDDWNDIKVDKMRVILREKVLQHEYVRRKLLATGERELIENSWRDDFWGWGPNRDGQNQLGKLWMEIRSDLRND